MDTDNVDNVLDYAEYYAGDEDDCDSERTESDSWGWQDEEQDEDEEDKKDVIVEEDDIVDEGNGNFQPLNYDGLLFPMQ
jgi:hypothetical protein